jgi:hypothetical protein
VNKTFILAAGSHSRWELELPKQLIHVFGKPLLIRTQNQVYSLTNQWPIVVANNHRIVSHSRKSIHYPTTSTVDAAMGTRKYWQDTVVILLGDVLFSEAAISAVYGSDSPIGVFGSSVLGEIFALKIAPSGYAKAVKHLSVAVEDFKYGGRGKLWEFYRSLCGFSLKEHKYDTVYFHNIHDELTRDFDTVEQYYEFKRCYPYPQPLQTGIPNLMPGTTS